MARVLPPLYVDDTADGFRLPSVAEYQQAAFSDTRRFSAGLNQFHGIETLGQIAVIRSPASARTPFWLKHR